MAAYRFGRCEIHLDRRELMVDGQLRPTTPKVFAVLVLLLEQHHRVVTKAELLDRVWLGAELSDSALARTVMLARRAIDRPGEPSPIRNLHGHGYRFVGEVQGVPSGTARPPPLAVASPVAGATPSAGGVDPGANGRGASPVHHPHAAPAASQFAATGSPGRFQDVPAHPAVHQALRAHGDALFARELWADAEAMYHAAVRLAPGDAALRLHHLRCLVKLGDERAGVQAQRLLHQASRAQDPALVARAHLALAQHLHRHPRAQRRARASQHLVEALRSSPQGADGADPALLLWLSLVQIEAGEAASARSTAQRAEALARQRQQAAELADAQLWQATLDMLSGELLHAQQALLGVADTLRGLGRRVSAAQAQAGLALCSSELGLPGAAEAHAGRAVDLLAECEPRGRAGEVLLAAALVQADNGSASAPPPQLLQLLEAGSPCPPAAGGTGAAPWQAARALSLIWSPQRAAARQLLYRACTTGSQSFGPLLTRHLGLLLLRLTQAAGQWAPARRVAKGLAELPRLPRDPGLQAALLHAQACDTWQQGRRPVALALLERVVAESPPCRAQAAALVDLAWLLIEEAQDEDTLQRAERLLSGLGTWSRTPLGLAAQARLALAQQDQAAAVQLQQQALQQAAERAPPWHLALAQAYGQAARGLPAALPPLLRWPSLSWLPD